MFSRNAKWAPLAILALASCPVSAQAGWITIKNDTTQTIVIQETSNINGVVRRGKPLKLFPGEVFREFQANPGQKSIQVMESGLIFCRQLCKGDLKWQMVDQDFVILKSAEKYQIMTPEEIAAAAKEQAARDQTISRAQAPMSEKK